MKKYLFPVLCTLMCISCQTKVDGGIKDLQHSVCRLSSVAHKVDHDVESLWAYGMADSIARSMELTDESQWRDLARVYSALTYISYGMSYTRTIMTGDPDKLKELTETVVEIDPDTIMPNKHLHFNELKSDLGFIHFYMVSNMESKSDMFDAMGYALGMFDPDYMKEEEPLSDKFKQFQRNNNTFYFIYMYMLYDLFSINSATDEEYNNKCDALISMAEELDALPDDWDKMLAKKIEIRTRLLNILADEILALKEGNE